MIRQHSKVDQGASEMAFKSNLIILGSVVGAFVLPGLG